MIEFTVPELVKTAGEESASFWNAVIDVELKHRIQPK